MKVSTRLFEFVEEIGSMCHEIKFDVEFELDPGEPMVMYYPDGSGHPGSPPSAAVLGVTVQQYDGSLRKDKEDWFKLLDSIVLRHVDANAQHYEEETMLELVQMYEEQLNG